MAQSTATPSIKPNPLPKSTVQFTSKLLTRSKFKLKKIKKSDLPKKCLQKVKNAASHARRPLTRSAATGTFGRAYVKGKDSQAVFVSLSSEEESSDSHDSYDSIEDDPYRPAGDEISSEEEEVIVKRVVGKKSDVKKRTTTDKKEVKEKRDVMLEDDGLRAVDEEAAVVAAATAADTDANGGEVNDFTPTIAINSGDAPLVEIQLDLSQLVLSETDDFQQVQPLSVRPTKLPPKRKLSTTKKNTPSTSTPAATTQPIITPPVSTPSASTQPASTQPANALSHWSRSAPTPLWQTRILVSVHFPHNASKQSWVIGSPSYVARASHCRLPMKMLKTIQRKRPEEKRRGTGD
ncbi:hypothetical protein Ahy_A08g037914 [Arachis hypogaea]|uniref:Uncharacterized protein n=1 Tax=Arachis hypogaea TaxID=3818 RepID=A0A445BS50_ARAHY|nr:hypothetical protein Ahy_A08g037914 [Arachis hypogaea]